MSAFWISFAIFYVWFLLVAIPRSSPMMRRVRYESGVATAAGYFGLMAILGTLIPAVLAGIVAFIASLF